jgi:hypothetical protein
VAPGLGGSVWQLSAQSRWDAATALAGQPLPPFMLITPFLTTGSTSTKGSGYGKTLSVGYGTGQR